MKKRLFTRLASGLLCGALLLADVASLNVWAVSNDLNAEQFATLAETGEESDADVTKNEVEEKEVLPEMTSEEASESATADGTDKEEAENPKQEAEEPTEEDKEDNEGAAPPVEDEQESVSENTMEEEPDSVSENVVEDELGVNSVMAASEEIIASDKSNDILWTIDGNGKLTVSGTGDFERGAIYVEIGAENFWPAPWYLYDDLIKTAEVDVTDMTDASCMFFGCENLTSLDLSNFNTDKVTDMSCMFFDCSKMTSLDLSNFNTSNATNMSRMFNSCQNLAALDINNFNTSSVIDMSFMFISCRSLTTLDLSNFNTSNATDMSWMFTGCENLTTLDINNFNTSSVTDMSQMFWDCENLTMLDVSSFDTSSVTNMSGMFIDCKSLTTFDLSNFDTSSVTDMSSMFNGCQNLTMLDVSSFDTSSVTYMSSMFSGCQNLTMLDVSSFDTSSVTSMGNMFYGCGKLTKLDLSSFNTGNVASMGGMFEDCESLTELDLSSFNTGNVTFMVAMFSACKSLTTLDLSSFDTSRVSNMNSMFNACENLISLDLSNFDTSSVTGMGYMFYGCGKLTKLDLSSFNIGNVTFMVDMFKDCENLATIHTPRNVKLSVELPVNQGSTWYCSDDGTVVTELPKDLDHSVTLVKKYDTSEEKPDIPPNDDPKNDDDDGIDDKDIPEDGIIPEGLWISEIAVQTYTGAAIKPEVRVYDGEKRLKQGIDYTLSYKNNTIAAGDADIKPPTVVVNGKGNYSGMETKAFTITKRDISDTCVTKTFTDAYTPLANGKSPTLVFAAKCNNKALKKNTDYTLIVKDSDGKEVTSYGAAGTYTAVIKGTGKNYTGECSFSFEVLDKVPVSKLKIGKIAAVKYDGTSKTPEPVIKYGKLTLGKGTDYTLSYQNNTEIGTATIIISGMGDYFGTRNVTFSITGLPIKQAKFTGFINSFPYTGDKVYQSKAVLKYGENNLVEGKDYTVSYSNYLNKGKATATYVGIGAYTGSIKKTYNITAYNIAIDSQKRIKLSTDAISAVYTKGGAAPSLKVYDGIQLLTEGKDYTLSYQNNAAVTTSATVKQPTIMVKGKGNYSGVFSEKKTFTITAKDIAEVTVTAPDVAASQKTGKYESTPVLTDTNGKKLKAGTDYDKTYTYTYKNKTEKVLNNGTEVTRNAGDSVDAKDIIPANTVLCVHIKAKEGGNYTGEKTADYRVTASLISKAKITVQNPAQKNTNLFPYTGQAIRLDKSNLIVKVGTEVLSEDQYEILEDTYKNNVGKGTASVQIKGVGNYGGTATVKFKIGTKGLQWFKRLFG